MQTYEISADSARLNLIAIHAALTQTYWAQGIPFARVETLVRNSVCVGAYLGSEQVGFARVVTDKATFAYLADVYVLAQHRGNRLSRRMLEMIFGLPELQGLRRMMLATRDAHGLYEKFGFKPLLAPLRFMERHDPDAYAAPPPNAL
jgi:GNAT superfamily N-acetyltransferase